MTPEQAEEYSQALGQVVSGSWRQVALGHVLGVPQALGLTTEEWVNGHLGGYVKLQVAERREAVTELRSNGHSQRETAEILGIGQATVHRDSNGSNEQKSKCRSDPNESPIAPDLKRRADEFKPKSEAERLEEERLAFTRDWWKRTESALLHLSAGCRAKHYADEYGPIYQPVEPFTVPELIDDVITGLVNLKEAIAHER